MVKRHLTSAMVCRWCVPGYSCSPIFTSTSATGTRTQQSVFVFQIFLSRVFAVDSKTYLTGSWNIKSIVVFFPQKESCPL
uniref:Uncharacterized protein n=1 Tax=Anguilla anguilla TaxID=7936 RepID=A0A0E9WNB1_ANGAN